MSSSATSTHPRLPRFYVPDLPHPRVSDHRCAIGPEETRHLRKVLRLSVGDLVELFDARGGRARARIEQFDSGCAVAHVLEVHHDEPARPHVTLAAPVPKGSRADDMVDQLCQLGADRFVPLLTERSVVEPREHKLERFLKHSLEACKQSRRAYAMELTEPAELVDVFPEKADVKLIAVPGARREGPHGDLTHRLQHAQTVIVLVGPEGGWTDAELDAAAGAGYLPWNLGPHVLRIETAATAAVAILRYISAHGDDAQP